MLKWLFRKRIQRTAAIENYLTLFSTDELLYLNDIAIIGIEMRVSRRNGDVMRDIEISAFIIAAVSARMGKVPETIVGLASARTAARLALAGKISAMAKAKNMQPFDRMSALSDFRIGIDYFSSKDEFRLSLHVSMIGRIYDDGTAANLLPELDDYGEGQAWEAQWRRATS